MSYYFNDLMSNQLKLIDEKVQHDGLILLVFVSKNCQSGPLSSFAQHSSSITPVFDGAAATAKGKKERINAHAEKLPRAAVLTEKNTMHLLPLG